MTVTFQQKTFTLQVPALLTIPEQDAKSGQEITLEQREQAAKDNFGVENPNDLITMTATTGSVVFDICAQHTKKDLAPILLKKSEAKLLKLSESLSQEEGEIELSDEYQTLLTEILSDNKKFGDTAISFVFKGEDKTIVAPMRSVIINALKELSDALTALCKDEEAV